MNLTVRVESAIVDSVAQTTQLPPELFCWTRFGTEAGESVDAILRRKEQERRANSGVFLWGIGNSIAPAVRELIRQVAEPEVLFSPIRSAPRPVDVAPRKVVEWTVAETLDGERLVIPPSFRVRGGSGTDSLTARYALICASDEPLTLGDRGSLDFGALRNMLSGNGLGASQVTAVVRRLSNEYHPATFYPVALRARLVAPFFVRLREPVPLQSVNGIRWTRRTRQTPVARGRMLRPLLVSS